MNDIPILDHTRRPSFQALDPDELRRVRQDMSATDLLEVENERSRGEIVC